MHVGRIIPLLVLLAFPGVAKGNDPHPVGPHVNEATGLYQPVRPVHFGRSWRKHLMQPTSVKLRLTGAAARLIPPSPSIIVDPPPPRQRSRR
jgi:hypothetical protein